MDFELFTVYFVTASSFYAYKHLKLHQTPFTLCRKMTMNLDFKCDFKFRELHTLQHEKYV